MKLNLVSETDLTRPEMDNIKLRLSRVEAKEISTVTLGAIPNSLLTAKGDLIVASAASTPARYGVVAPAAGLLNVLGVANAEDTPTYKALFDTTAASAVSLAAGTAGTQLVAARRDHTHLVTASSAPGAAAAILATDASGHTSVISLGIGASPSSVQKLYIAGTASGTSPIAMQFATAMTATGSGAVPVVYVKPTVTINSGVSVSWFAGFNVDDIPITNNGTLTYAYGLRIKNPVISGNAATYSYAAYFLGAVAVEGSLVVSPENDTQIPTLSDGVGVDVKGKLLRLRESKTPASATATGNVGEICWDASYIYVCTASNTWERAALASW